MLILICLLLWLSFYEKPRKNDFWNYFFIKLLMLRDSYIIWNYNTNAEGWDGRELIQKYANPMLCMKPKDTTQYGSFINWILQSSFFVICLKVRFYYISFLLSLIYQESSQIAVYQIKYESKFLLYYVHWIISQV